MTDANANSRFALSPWRYRWVDRLTKLTGVALIAIGLDTGGGTLAGMAFAVLGVTFGLVTVLIDEQ